MKPKARIILDSISSNEVRLVTMEVTMHRFVLAEFNTHRVFSRNSASSRAIPYSKIRDKVRKDLALPVYWGTEQKGMQSGDELEGIKRSHCENHWISASNAAINHADYLVLEGLHKSLANRLLEPFMSHTVIVTSTDWSNFFAQRFHKDAQPEIRAATKEMLIAFKESEPTLLNPGEWHTPLIRPEDEHDLLNLASERISRGFTTASVLNETIELRKQISAARCARVSYMNHDGVRSIAADFELYERLVNGMHYSPFEHIATPCHHIHHIYQIRRYAESTDFDVRCKLWGNFYGWHQYRKTLAGENRTFDFSDAT